MTQNRAFIHPRDCHCQRCTRRAGDTMRRDPFRLARQIDLRGHLSDLMVFLAIAGLFWCGIAALAWLGRQILS